jgi:glycosyltransferase involved in cell wall biosynthesis
MAIATIPVSAVVATKDRAGSLVRTLDSLAGQGILPAELIVVDGSAGDEGRELLNDWRARVGDGCAVRWSRAEQMGAAVQRNQGVALVTQPYVWFFDDDIRFERECISKLWRALQSDSQIGGVNAMIVNQQYHPPGAVSRMMFTLMHGRREGNFAGRVIGPAVTLLPEDRNDLPEVVPVEWLNTTCTMYRREALPSPPFDSVFTGYSLMEDLTLSLRVGKKWRLANARTARIFHDSQPGAHKSNARVLAAMELANRYYVTTEVLGRRGIIANLRLALWEVFQLLVVAARPSTRSKAWAMFRGQLDGLRQICS